MWLPSSQSLSRPEIYRTRYHGQAVDTFFFSEAGCEEIAVGKDRQTPAIRTGELCDNARVVVSFWVETFAAELPPWAPGHCRLVKQPGRILRSLVACPGRIVPLNHDVP